MNRADDPEDLYPLSPLQQGMLFEALRSPEAGVGIEQDIFDFDGALDAAVLRAAWEAVGARHAALRTSFIWEDIEEPHQVVHARGTTALEEVDLRGQPAAQQPATIESRMRTERVRGFDLTRLPLMRLTLFRVADDRFRMLWTYHHLLLDGWSMQLVMRDVAAEYAARATAAPESSVPVAATELHGAPLEPPRPYRDYIAWLLGQDTTAAETYWRGRLVGVRNPTPLTVDRRSEGEPNDPADRFATVAAELARADSDALRSFARSRNLTLNTLVQAAWALLLARYSGNDEVIFGCTVSGRPVDLDGVDGMVGLFINTLPLRVATRRDTQIGAWLAALQLQIAELKEYEFSSLPRIQRCAELAPGQPLFESVVVVENFPERARALGSIDVRHDFRHRHTQTGLPLSLIVFPYDELRCEIKFDTGRFDVPTIERMLGHYRNLLTGIAVDAARTLGEVALVAGAEREQLLQGFNATARDFGAEFGADVASGTLQHAFERQARLTPGRIALEFGTAHLTYGELDARSNRLARFLVEAGVGADQLVAISVERSLEMVVGLLGILKAGGAYVPVDPSLPAERLEFMLGDAGASILLTQERLLPRLPAHAGRTVCLDRDWAAIEAHDASALPARSAAHNLAYMIFTSGSTGRPKGAMNAHAGIVNRLLWMQAEYRLTAEDAVLQKTPFSFDVSVWEFFWPLLTGARLVVAEPGGHQDPAYLAETIEARRITVLHFVPSMLRAFVDAGWAGKCGSLRDVMCSGEALAPDLVEAFNADFKANLHNLYGPTEAAVDVTYWPCPRGGLQRLVPIGKPVANTQCYVLDGALEPLPIGVPGELFLGGIQVGRGYRNRPELTAEKFIADPFRAGPHARLYRTGDLCRFMADGNIEYLGRIDHQVKIRGFRIELGEIEAVLASHPSVRDNVVVAREMQRGEKKLVAYVVGDFTDPGFADLRAHLARQVPEYMVPAIFVAMEKLPLNTNGKVDRGALPAPQLPTQDAAAFVAPANARELKLAAIWQKVLRLERVGRTDNFFELGGDSILSIQVVSLARQQGLVISPRLLFANPTVGALAAAASESGAGTTAAATSAEPEHAAALMTPVQSWFFDQRLEQANWFNQAFMFSLARPLEEPALRRALSRLADRHDALRLRFAADAAGVWRQAAVPRAEPQQMFESHDLSSTADDALAAALTGIAVELQSRLDFTTGPTWRVAQVDCGAQRGARLAIAIHHLAVDGVSWRILVEDLEALYATEHGESTGALAQPTSSFLAWAHRLQAREAGAAFTAQLDYWSATVRAAAELPLPQDFDHGANTEESVANIGVTLDVATTSALLQRAPAAYNTQINDLLLAALARATAAWTGRRELALSLEGHGREDLFEGLDLSRSVGWFTSIFPVRLTLGTDNDLGAELCSVKETLRRVPDRGIGFGLLRHVLRAPVLAGLEDPQLVFNYLGQTDQVVAASRRFALAPESTGPWHSPRQLRKHLLEIDAQVLRGRLEVGFRYSRNRHSAATIERLANGFRDALLGLVKHCTTPGVGHATPADFPACGLDQAALLRVTGGDRNIEDVYPLAPMQSLFMTVASAGGSVVDQWTCDFVGPLDGALLRGAWDLVLQRHATLRSSFVTDATADPMQRVHRRVTAPWTLEDWSSQPESERELLWRGALDQERSRLEDLGAAPLVRFLLARVGAARWRFAWTVPALLLDGWSWPLVFSDLGRAYAALEAGATPALPAPRSYRDYVQFMQRLDLGAAEAFWRARLAGLSEPTPLPSAVNAHDAGALSTAQRFAQIHGTAEPTLGARVAQAARAAQVTTNTLVQTAWGLVLARMARRTDVLFGASFAGRPNELEGIEQTVGAFTNNVPVRVGFDPGETCASLVARTQDSLAQTAEHQLAPLERIQSWSSIPWHERMFDSLLVVQNYQVDDAARRLAAGIAIDRFSGPIHSSFPLLVLVEPGTPWFASVVHDTRAVAASAAMAALEDFRRALGVLANNPELPVAGLLEQLSEPGAPAAPARKARTRALHVVAAQTPLEKEILAVWRETLGLDAVSVEENLLDLGVQSLLVIRLHHRLRSALKRDFSVITMFTYPTIRALADHLGGPATPADDSASVSERAQRQRRALARMKPPTGRRQGS